MDYIAIGPIFGTSTKDTGYGSVGTALVTEAAGILRESRATRCRLIAIGGITLRQAPDVILAGATSVAVISDLLASGNPESRVREYLQVLRDAVSRK